MLGAWMFNAIYKWDAYQFNCTDGADEQDVDGRLPRRRPARGDVRRRTPHGRARRRGRQGPARDPRDELDQARGVPVHHGRGHDLRLRQLRGRHGARPRRCSATTSSGPSSSSAGRTSDPVQLGIGVSTFTEMCGLAPSRVLGQLNYGAGGWEHAIDPDAADRQGRGHHRRERARPGPRDGVQPDRRRPARRALRGRRDPARRHAGLAQGPGHLRLAVAGGRWRGAGAGRRQGDREGQADRGAPARGERRRPRVRRRPVLRQGHRPGHDDHRGGAGDLRVAQLPRRRGARDRRRRRRTTR